MAVSATKTNQESTPCVVVFSSDEALRDAISYWFSSLSVPVVATDDGAQANRAAKAAGLLIVDRIMPPSPDLDTFLQLKTVNPTLHIAFVDDRTWDGAILARVSGASTVLQRPLNRERVVGLLSRTDIVR